MTQERDRQEWRTRTVRRTVIALGATGALGAAGAIGFGIATAQGADPTTDDSGSQGLPSDTSGSRDLGDQEHGDHDHGDEEHGDQEHGDPPPLAGPGDGGAPQGTTGGS